MPSPSPVTVGDMVRLVFKGWPSNHPKTGQPLQLSWNSRPYQVDEHSETFLPFDCAKSYFGDPRSVEGVIRIKDDLGNDMIIADRAAEVRRLQTFWQNAAMATNNAKFREYIPGDRSYLNDGISDLLPNIEVYTLSGQRVLMVTDDPYGDHVMVTQQTRAESERIRTQLLEQSDVITELKKQNRILLEKLGLDADLLNPEISPKSQDPALETPVDPVIEEKPKMVYNPRTRRVTPARRLPPSDPTTIEDLPQDLD